MTINGIAAGMRNTGWLQIINGNFRGITFKIIPPFFKFVNPKRSPSNHKCWQLIGKFTENNHNFCLF
jgi:hypothetical protein